MTRVGGADFSRPDRSANNSERESSACVRPRIEPQIARAHCSPTTSHTKLAAEAVAHLPKLCTQEQVQATLNISPRTMGRYVVDGTIPAVRFGG